MAGTIIISLTPQEYFGLIRGSLSLIILAYVARLPLKRSYYVPFMLYAACCAGFSFEILYANSAPTAYLEYVRSQFVSLWGPGLEMALLYHFSLNFVTRKMSGFQKYSLLAAYAYAISNGLWTAIDEPLSFSPGVKTATGYSIGPGYLTRHYPWLLGIPGTPFNYYYLIVTVLTLYALLRPYRAQSGLVKSQIHYLSAGIVIDWVSVVWLSLASYVAKGIPNLQNLIGVTGTAILLVGLTRHKFYRVTPTSETAGVVPQTYPLEGGRSYLAKDIKPSFEAFSELVRNGHEGFCITRTSPEGVRTSYGLETTPIRWLAEEKREDAIPPTDLLGLSLTVKDFVSKAERPVVVLQGIEYLVRLNGFNPVLRLVDGLNEASAPKNGIILLMVLPNTLGQKEEALLAAETTPLPPPSNVEGRTQI